MRVLLAAAFAALSLSGAALASCPTDAELCVNNDAANVWVQDGQVWRGGDAALDSAVCMPEYVVYHLDESQSDLWYDCWREPHRVL